MSRCPVSQAEIDNDQPYRSHNRDAIEENDRAMDNLRIERREFIESMLKKGYAACGGARDRKTYHLSEAIDMIADREFWNTLFELSLGGVSQQVSLARMFEQWGDSVMIADMYIDGHLPQWHAEIHKQVVLLADMALGEV